MKLAGTKGLVEFQCLQLVLERGPAATWKRLSIAADQGSDVIAATNALLRLFKINLDFFSDTSHGGHNDFWNSRQRCDIKGFLYMFLLGINTPHGPWSEDTRWKQCTEHLAKMVHEAEPFDMPMFRRCCLMLGLSSQRRMIGKMFA